ncbi:MAG: sensor histidine kinase [Thermodesulfobacteriota bacterium]
MTPLISLKHIRQRFVTRVIATMTAATLLLSLLFAWYLVGIQRRIFDEQITSGGRVVAAMLAENLRYAVFAENEEECVGPVEALFVNDDVMAVHVFTAGGGLLYQQSRDTGANLLLTVAGGGGDLRPLFRRVAENGFLEEQAADFILFWSPVRLAAGGSEDDLLASTAGMANAETIGYVGVAMGKEEFHRSLTRIYGAIGLAMVVFLVVGLGTMLLVIGRMSEPLNRLLRRVREKGGEGNGADDLTLLSDTWDAMIRDLEQSFAEISSLKDGLEDKVTQRTAELDAANRELEQTIARLRAAQDQLLQQEKMAAVGRLVAGIAHEMNNSVNFISAALPPLKRCLAELQEAGAADSEAAAEIHPLVEGLAGNIEEGARRLTRIIGDLKLFSRREDESPVEVDIHAVIDSSLPLANGGEHGEVEIIRDYRATERVRCLPGRISQVVVNICTNAIQAMAGRGTLTIATARDGEYIAITFRDTGPGIAPEVLPRIFEPFYTTKEVGKGTGLGLGICYSIIRQHGGDIRVKSRPGEGAVFTVLLPG